MLFTFEVLSSRLPGGFAQNSSQNAPPPSLPEPESVSSPVETLTIEEVQAPASGTRKAKVLYDYDAADCSELSLLADEVSFHNQCLVPAG